MKCHYVPQFYLKNFAISGKKDFLYAYGRNRKPFIVSTKGIAAKNDLYIFTDKNTGQKSMAIEKMFAELEGMVSPIIKNIINGFTLLDLSNTDHNVLSEFIACLNVRNLSQRQIQKNIYAEFSKLQLKRMAAYKQIFQKILTEVTNKIDTNDDKKVEELRQSILEFDKNFKLEVGNGNNDYFLKQSLEIELKIDPIIFNKEWHILDSTGSSRVFITSDNPVVIIKPDNWPSSRGVGIANGFIAVPLSPTKCLWLTNGKSDPSVIQASRKMIDSVNSHIMFFAYKFIYSNILAKDFENLFNKTKDGEGEQLVVEGGLE